MVVAASDAPTPCPTYGPITSRALASVSPLDLKADLSFLSSDALAGRSSPSHGLDTAAEFIASRFRAAGLDPGGDSGYFQLAVLEGKIPKRPNSQEQANVRNVVAILRGSDPTLKKSYVLLTAHYDHLGTTATAGREAADHPAADSKDQIYNGANDDGSGTVSVIAIARALANVRPRPKRSIVFILFFGEELGLRGSEYYAQNPTVPLADVVADLNLEQIGRTDSTEGPELNRFSLTGIGYSSVSSTMKCSAARLGVNVYLDNGNDDYFVRSDNASFAKKGIPAHTICVAFDFADYHRVSDEWQKIDYSNMAKIDRAIALGVLDLANNQRSPQWNRANPKTLVFRQAQQALHNH